MKRSQSSSTASGRIATIVLRGPAAMPPASADEMVVLGAAFWPLQLARELDDAILDIRLNEFDVAAIVFKSFGDPGRVMAYEQFLDATRITGSAREIRHFWKRVLKRVDLTSRSLVTLIEPGSCFAGTLAELVFATDRSYMFSARAKATTSRRPRSRSQTRISAPYPMSNGLTRLGSRFLADTADLERAKAERHKMLDAERAQKLGLVTFALDDIDWDDEVRVFLEERASFSPDGLTGLEANLRFAGPETMESKNLRAADRMAELDFPAPQCGRRRRGTQRYGTGQTAGLRYAPGLNLFSLPPCGGGWRWGVEATRCRRH